MKAFVSAQLDETVLEYLRRQAQVTLGGWGHTGSVLSPEQLVQAAQDCQLLVICYEPVNDYVLDRLPGLRFIACTRGGVENFDKDAFKRHPQVMACNAPGRNANAVADLTLGLMLDVTRQISLSNHYIRNRDWEHAKWFKAGKLKHKLFMGYELAGKTLGLVGYGEVGRRVARRALGFDMRVLVYDPYISREQETEQIGFTDLEALLRQSDFVSLHCKSTPQTANLINTETLSLMRPTAYLINTARGTLVNETDLYQALTQKRIGGAALDTLAAEPIAENHPFIDLPNIVLTPHIGGASYDIQAQQSAIVLEDLQAFFQGRRPPHLLSF